MRISIGYIRNCIRDLLPTLVCGLVEPIKHSRVKKYSESAPKFDGNIELSNNSYPVTDLNRAYKKAKTGFNSIGSVQKSVEEKISEFAKKQGKLFVILVKKIGILHTW